jgi:signal transduction histidine kinase
MAPLDLAEIVDGLGELYEPLAEEAGLSLSVKVEPELSLTGNRELIGQALANLIDNALKYGKPEGEAPATVEVTARRVGDMVELGVADHGAGIPEADRARVLERFVRLDKSRSKPGFGLGLALASAVARLHGGAVQLADNAPGLRVEMSLPLAPPAVESPAVEESAGSTSPPKPAGFQSA